MKQQMELVEKLVEKTGLSYTECREALEKNEWDALDAMIWLESQGKVNGKTTASYTTYTPYSSPKTGANKGEGTENFKKQAKSFGEWLKSVLEKGNTNCLVVSRKNENIISIPVTVFIILLLLLFWVIVPLMIVSLFFSFRYSFSGPDLGKDSVNNAMGKATDVADSIKNEIVKADSKTDIIDADSIIK